MKPFQNMKLILKSLKNTNALWFNQLNETERQCWENAQYSRRECIEIVGIPLTLEKEKLEIKIYKSFDKTGVTVTKNDI